MAIALIVFVALILLLIAPRVFFLFVSLGGIALLLVSALVMVATFRKAKSISPRSLLIGMALSLLIALLYPALTRSSPEASLPMSGLLFGGLIGIGWGLTSSVFIDQGTIRSRGSAWYLVAWALTLAVPQGLALLSGRPPTLALLLMYSGTGLVLGQSGLTLVRYFQLKPRLGALPSSHPS